MIPNERRNQIIESINSKGYISVEELASLLYVSLATVRRDLNELENQGLLKRTHGGASFIGQNQMFTSIDYRTNYYSDEKIQIGKTAAKLVDDGMNIFIDSSSTTLWFSKELVHKKDLHVLTNSMAIAQILSKEASNKVEITCGTYDYKHGSIFGSDVASYINQRHGDILFVSASGLNSHGITTKAKRDIPSKQAFQDNSDLTVLLMDHSKFNLNHYYKVYDMNDIDILIVDHPLPDDLAKACKQHQINVIVANK